MANEATTDPITRIREALELLRAPQPQLDYLSRLKARADGLAALTEFDAEREADRTSLQWHSERVAELEAHLREAAEEKKQRIRESRPSTPTSEAVAQLSGALDSLAAIGGDGFHADARAALDALVAELAAKEARVAELERIAEHCRSAHRPFFDELAKEGILT